MEDIRQMARGATLQAIEEACNLRVKVIKPAIKGLRLSTDDISRKRDQHLRDNSKEIL